MSTITFEVIFILLLIIANGVFAMAEAAVVASRKARLQQAAQAGSHSARAALELAESPNRFLSTVQIGITLVGIFSGAFGGATLSRNLADKAREAPALAPYADSIGLGVVVICITYLSLIIGELVPKRLALQSPERIAALVAVPMRGISVAASPIVSILSFSTDMVLRLMGIKPSNDPPVTEEEIKVMIEQGTQAGVFEAAEQDIVERVFRLGDRRVDSLMTRRPDILWLNAEDSLEENTRKMIASPYSRLPVCLGDLDHVLGVVRAKDMLSHCLEGGAVDLMEVLRPPVYVPDSLPALKLLETLRRERTHIAIVIDEHGGTRGMLALQDILGAVVGDLPILDESDEPDAVQREDGSWLFDGSLAIEDLKTLCHVPHLPGDSAANYTTLSGFIMSETGRIPATGDYFEAAGLRFEVVDMDANRIDKVLVTPLQTEHSS
jgi:putative hemolysin